MPTVELIFFVAIVGKKVEHVTICQHTGIIANVLNISKQSVHSKVNAEPCRKMQNASTVIADYHMDFPDFYFRRQSGP